MDASAGHPASVFEKNVREWFIIYCPWHNRRWLKLKNNNWFGKNSYSINVTRQKFIFDVCQCVFVLNSQLHSGFYNKSLLPCELTAQHKNAIIDVNQIFTRLLCTYNCSAVLLSTFFLPQSTPTMLGAI